MVTKDVRQRFIREALEGLKKKTDKMKDTDLRLWKAGVLDELIAEFTEHDPAEDSGAAAGEGEGKSEVLRA